MSMTAKLPRFAVVEAALRTTTERLAAEVAAPRPSAPDWNHFEWEVARAVAAMQGITVLLANRLRWRGPERWQAFLRTQRTLALQREARIQSLLSAIDSALRANRVCCLGLKGSAVRALGLHGAGERPMGDVDLLSSHEDAARVAQALDSLDYIPVSDTLRHRIFAPRQPHPHIEPGEHPDNPLKIELHFRISEPLPVTHVDITAGLMPERPRPGLNGYACMRELLRHLLLHAAGNVRAHALRQIQLHEIALLSSRLESADWSSLLHTPDSRGGSWWMWPVLDMARRYYPQMPGVIEEFRAATPRWLRATASRATLTRHSWSNLRIAAFPGIQWSRSASEALRFMRGRVLPEPAALEVLDSLQILQPALMEPPWYGISHLRRILRWTFGRPPRVHTLVCLQAALGTGKSR